MNVCIEGSPLTWYQWLAAKCEATTKLLHVTPVIDGEVYTA